MKKGIFLRNVMLLALLALPMAYAHSLRAQPSPIHDQIYQTIAALDTKVFDAYNHCDLVSFARYFSKDVEFYHDQTGLMVGRDNLVESIKLNICGKVTRQLVPGKMEVYPLHGYGAVEIGIHRFYHPNEIMPAGEAKFIHIWRYQDGEWKITRVISFNHVSLAK